MMIEATPTKPRQKSAYSERQIHIRELLANRGPLSTVEIAKAVRSTRVKTMQTLYSLEGNKAIKAIQRNAGPHRPFVWALRCYREG